MSGFARAMQVFSALADGESRAIGRRMLVDVIDQNDNVRFPSILSLHQHVTTVYQFVLRRKVFEEGGYHLFYLRGPLLLRVKTYTTNVRSAASTTVGSDYATNVGSAKNTTVGSAHTANVGSAKNTTVGSAYATNVGSAKNTTVGSAHTTNVGSPKNTTMRPPHMTLSAAAGLDWGDEAMKLSRYGQFIPKQGAVPRLNQWRPLSRLGPDVTRIVASDQAWADACHFNFVDGFDGSGAAMLIVTSF